jgi:hypothetical protein
MARYIDADRLIEVFDRNLMPSVASTLKQYVDAQPTVDAAPVWISVKDRLPEKFKPVIVCREDGKGQPIVEQGYKDIGDWWKVYGTRTKHVTHWMPMPEPPKEGNQ